MIARVKAAPKWEFLQIDPAHLHKIWDLVHPGLLQVIRRGEAQWRPEDVYYMVKGGNATLHVAYLDFTYVGFAVLTRVQDPFTGELTLFIWATYSTDPRAISLGLADIERIAKRDKFDKLAFHSPRKAWLRRLEKSGFTLTQLVIEKRLSNAS